MAYSPFDVTLANLTADNLAVLQTVGEGWYVEYKREVPNAASIAKSISAFANTYGGWLFYGIEEKSKDESVAGAFLGVPRADVDACLQRIRQAVASLLNPSPHFDSKLLWGPCEVGLASDRAIICIQIPWSPVAPHVHKSGYIYRRVADGSEPRPENDRSLLDQLFRRADALREECREWIDRKPEFSEREGERPYLRLMMIADRWRDRNAWVDINVEEVREILGRPEGIVTAVPFDNVYSMSGGFAARQQKGNDPFDLGLTWRFRNNLVSEVLIPLNCHFGSLQALLNEMDGYESITRFCKLLFKQGHKDPRIVDLNILFNVLVGVVEIQNRLLERAGWKDAYFAKVQLLNVWRTIPYLDISHIIDEFENHGTPMCLDGNVLTTPGKSPESFVEIGRFTHVDSEHARVIIQALNLFGPVALAYGLPVWTAQETEDSTSYYFQELQAAGERGVKVQRRRKPRS